MLICSWISKNWTIFFFFFIVKKLSKIVTCKEIKGEKLTVKAFRAEHSHNVWNSMIEKWGTHRVPYREFPGWFHEETSIFKRSHSIRPCFTARINEATVDPARHFVYLQPHVFRATFHDLFPSIWTIFDTHNIRLLSYNWFESNFAFTYVKFDWNLSGERRFVLIISWFIYLKYLNR